MKKIPFDIKYRPQIESGEYKVVTDKDEAVRIICWDRECYNPIMALVKRKKTGYDAETIISEESPIYCDIKGKANLRENDLFILTNEPELTEFEQGVRDMVINVFTTTHSVSDVMDYNTTHLLAAGLLELAKKEICNGCTVGLNQYWNGRDDERKEAQKFYTFQYPPYYPPCRFGGMCTNPFKDCINCPRTCGDIGISTTSGTCKKD